MKTRWVILACGLAGTSLLAILGVSPDPDTRVYTPARPAAPSAAASSSASPRLEKLEARATLLGEGITAADSAPAGTLFAAHSWAPPLPAPHAAKAAGPMLPPLPFTYLGKQRADGQWQVFLSQGDALIVARPHQVIDDVYEVARIAPPTMTLRYLPLEKTQQMVIE